MSELRAFEFDGEPVHAEMVNGEVMFLGKAACGCLGITTQQRAFTRIPDDEKVVRTTHNLGGGQEMVWLREAGLYRLIFQSRKARAERFRAWVFNTVLPEIRRTGSFAGSSANAKPELGDVLSLARACELVRRTHGQAAARHLWAEMGGLPLPAEAKGVVKRAPLAPAPLMSGKGVTKRSPLTSAPGSAVDGVTKCYPIASRRPVSPAKAAADARFLQAVELFVRDCCVVSAEDEIQALPLYLAYDAWEARRGRRPMSQTRFGRTMRHAGYQKTKLREIYYYGLRLRPGMAVRPA